MKQHSLPWNPIALISPFFSHNLFILTCINYLFHVLNIYSLIPSHICSCFSSFFPCCSVAIKYEENNIPEICLTPLLPPFPRDSLLTALYLFSVVYSGIHLPHLNIRNVEVKIWYQSPQVFYTVSREKWALRTIHAVLTQMSKISKTNDILKARISSIDHKANLRWLAHL